MTNDKKILGVSTIAVIALILIAVASTYAFFKATEAGDDDTPLTVTTNTTDSLVFNVDTDITMVADMSNFTEGKGNREGTANATATLKANNKTNSATSNYYLYFDIKENELKYTTEAKTAELILQVTGPDGALGDGDIPDLNYVTVTDGKGEQISGFDITEVQDLITIVSNKEITTTSEKVDNWEIKVILINLNEDQSGNGGKKFNGEIIIQKEKKLTFAEYITTKVYTGIQGENNIYYHKNLANSAEDGSYRYAGSYEAVNNYVCFGSDEESCPWDNMYRIIGVFDNKVKLIKADYAKISELGTNGDFRYTFDVNVNSGENKGVNPTSEIGSYYWNYSNGTNSKNNWNESRLNTENLNGNYLNSFDDIWKLKIANTTWISKGNTWENQLPVNAPILYQSEIVNTVSPIKYSGNIGLMYMSDYMYGATPDNWTKHTFTNKAYPDSNGNYGIEYDYRSAKNLNWMYGGLVEWTIAAFTNNINAAGRINESGDSTDANIYSDASVRPCFYLAQKVVKISGDGSINSPYRIK